MLWCGTKLTHPSPFSGLLLTVTALCPSRATAWTGGRLALRHGKGAMLGKPLCQQRSTSATSLKKPATSSVSVPWMTLARVLTWTCREASTWVRLMYPWHLSYMHCYIMPLNLRFLCLVCRFSPRTPSWNQKRPDKQHCSHWWGVLYFCGAVCCLFWLLVPQWAPSAQWSRLPHYQVQDHTHSSHPCRDCWNEWSWSQVCGWRLAEHLRPVCERYAFKACHIKRNK